MAYGYTGGNGGYEALGPSAYSGNNYAISQGRTLAPKAPKAPAPPRATSPFSPAPQIGGTGVFTQIPQGGGTIPQGGSGGGGMPQPIQYGGGMIPQGGAGAFNGMTQSPQGSNGAFTGGGQGYSGVFDSNRAKYNLGGEAYADTSVQGAMDAMGRANPWNGNYQNAAGQGGLYAGQEGQANIGQGYGMRNGANSVMNTAFDPQNALRDRETQRLQDQIRVGQAARGITSSPYGAGLEDQAMSNFNLDWQDRQLGRQTQGLSAAGTANQQGGALGQMGVDQTQAQGQMPWNAYEQQRNSGQQSIQNWLNYLGVGGNATSGNTQLIQPPSTITFGGGNYY